MIDVRLFLCSVMFGSVVAERCLVVKCKCDVSFYLCSVFGGCIVEGCMGGLFCFVVFLDV